MGRSRGWGEGVGGRGRDGGGGGGGTDIHSKITKARTRVYSSQKTSSVDLK